MSNKNSKPVVTDINDRINELEVSLKKLASNYAKTNTQVDNLQQNIEEIENIKTIFNNNIDNISKINEQLDTIAPEIKNIKELKDLKSHIFAVMALFFGMFAFISIDLNFTKSIFSYSKDTTINSYLLVVCFIITQLFFFIFIYYFLLKPFLIGSSNNQSISSCKKFLITISILFILGIGYLSYENYIIKKE